MTACDRRQRSAENCGRGPPAARSIQEHTSWLGLFEVSMHLANGSGPRSLYINVSPGYYPEVPLRIVGGHFLKLESKDFHGEFEETLFGSDIREIGTEYLG